MLKEIEKMYVADNQQNFNYRILILQFILFCLLTCDRIVYQECL
jgi:hypothetical protein